MKISFTIRQIALTGLIVALIIGSFILGGIRYQRKVDRLNIALYSATDSIKKQELVIAKEKVNAYYARAAVVHTQQALQQLTRDHEYLKKLRITDVRTISNLKLEVEVLKKKGEYKEVVGIDNEVYDDNAFIVENAQEVISQFANRDTLRYASYRDEWVWANVWLYPDRPQFDLGVHSLPLRIDVGYQGFWKNEPVAVVTTPNPYVILKENKTVIVEEKKLWQKRYPWLIVGAVGGYLLAR